MPMMITAAYHLLTIMNCVIGQFFNILLQKPSGLILIIYYLFITEVNRPNDLLSIPYDKPGRGHSFRASFSEFLNGFELLINKCSIPQPLAV